MAKAKKAPAPVAEPKCPLGRPSSFTQEIADTICGRVSLGEPLRQICRDEGFPDQRTVYRWLESRDEFRQQYARAREAMMDSFADEILEIAEDGTNDWEERESARGNSYVALNSEAVARSNMRIEARKWLMGKCAPKKYGDKLQLGGDPANPMVIEIVRFGADGKDPAAG